MIAFLLGAVTCLGLFAAWFIASDIADSFYRRVSNRQHKEIVNLQLRNSELLEEIENLNSVVTEAWSDGWDRASFPTYGLKSQEWKHSSYTSPESEDYNVFDGPVDVIIHPDAK